MPVPSIEQQTGWKRPYPQMICQDPEVRLAIREFDYDLNNPEFVKYYKSRTGVQIDQFSCPRAWDSFKSVELNPNCIVGETHLRLMRGALQDCWELFTQTSAGKPQENKSQARPVQAQLFTI